MHASAACPTLADSPQTLALFGYLSLSQSNCFASGNYAIAEEGIIKRKHRIQNSFTMFYKSMKIIRDTHENLFFLFPDVIVEQRGRHLHTCTLIPILP